VRKNLPAATIVFEHFHLIKLFNDKLQHFRRWLFNRASATEKNILKGIRWLLLKNPKTWSRLETNTDGCSKPLNSTGRWRPSTT